MNATATLKLGELEFTADRWEEAKAETAAICHRCNAVAAKADEEAQRYRDAGERELKVAAKNAGSEARRIKREAADAYFAWASEVGLGMQAYGDF